MTSSDVFAKFVGIVGDTLDDPGLTGERIAQRVYLSRYHCGRVLTALAGESPIRFRRRVLLERAAFRLMTTELSVLDVAVEAGYSSHEAFTRAFAREHGEPPAQWRRLGTRNFYLEAPSGVHFHPPAGLRLPARGKVSGMDLLVKMVEHHVWLTAEMVKAARQLDDSTLDDVMQISVEGFDTEPTIRHLLDRLVWQLEMWLASVADEPFELPPHEARPVSLDSIAQRHAIAGPRFLTFVKDLSDQGRFDETFVDATCEPPRVFTYGGMVSHVLTFAAFRRGLIVCALDKAGVTDLGNGDPMHFVATS